MSSALAVLTASKSAAADGRLARGEQLLGSCQLSFRCGRKFFGSSQFGRGSSGSGCRGLCFASERMTR